MLAAIVIVSYLLTGVALVVLDFMVPFHDRPAYARHPKLKDLILMPIGWLPIRVLIICSSGHKYEMFKEILRNPLRLFIFLLIVGLWICYGL